MNKRIFFGRLLCAAIVNAGAYLTYKAGGVDALAGAIAIYIGMDMRTSVMIHQEREEQKRKLETSQPS